MAAIPREPVSDRPKLPRPLQREVLVEAGHRCSIPTCRQDPVDIAHIEPRKPDGSNDVYENLIVLCANCHRRHHQGEIDRRSLVQYKANLALMTRRYTEAERRILEMYGKQPELPNPMFLPLGFDIHLWYLLRDGLIVQTGRDFRLPPMNVPLLQEYVITDKGKEFIRRWFAAENLEDDDDLDDG
jgi:hypothetical protein